jgi:uncharacterized membrane protein
MNPLIKNRIESIDLLKGLVMVIMALDHTRDYFHAAAHFYDPTDPNHTSIAIYFTRWITHFCAPAFSFLAGLSAFLSGKKKTLSELSGFLLKRGLWLIFLELTVVNFAWFFDIHFHSQDLIVIWSLGISMIFLAALIHLPKSFILLFSCALIFGHNLLDKVHFEGNVLWAMIHDGGYFPLGANHSFIVFYPAVPWVGVMSLGYCFGSLYDKSFDSLKRKKLLNIIGFSAIALFLILNLTHFYGEPKTWKHYDTFSKTLMSFLDHRKYPPSLLYLLMTLGPSLIFLANTENLKGRIINFFSLFGRVPFFYYILHIYLIHITAMIFAQLSGFGWQKMILTDWVTNTSDLNGYGFSLLVVYLVWIGIIAIAYPFCKMFDRYKMNHKEKWWLSYL